MSKKRSSSKPKGNPLKADSESRTALKAQLIALREHLMLLLDEEKVVHERIIWFDAEFLSLISSSKAKKWVALKKKLSRQPSGIQFGGIAFSEIEKSHFDFCLNEWTGPPPGQDLGREIVSQLLSEAIRASGHGGEKPILVTRDFEISVAAQQRGFIVVEPDHANRLLETLNDSDSQTLLR